MRHFFVEYQQQLGPQIDFTADKKTFETYISFHPCQKLDIECQKLSQNGHFVCKFTFLMM